MDDLLIALALLLTLVAAVLPIVSFVLALMLRGRVSALEREAEISRGELADLRRVAVQQQEQIKRLSNRVAEPAAPRASVEKPAPVADVAAPVATPAAPPAQSPPVEAPAEAPAEAAPPPPAPPAPEAAAPAPEAPSEAASAPPPPTPPPKAEPARPAARSELPPPRSSGIDIERAGTWAFAALGGLALVLGMLLAFKYGWDQGWFRGLGPGARFAIGLGVGLGALGASELLYRRHVTIGAAALGAAGPVILQGALYAGHGTWHLMETGETFASMAMVAAFTLLLAWRRDSQFLAVLGLVGGLILPALLSTGENRPWALFGYLLVLVGGVSVPAMARSWPLVLALGGAGTAAYQLGWALKYIDEPRLAAPGMAAGVAFTLLYGAALVRKEGWTALAAAFALLLVGPATSPVLVAVDVGSWEGLVGQVFHEPEKIRLLTPLWLVLWVAALAVGATRRGWLPLGVLTVLATFAVAAPVALSWADAVQAAEPESPFRLLPTLGVVLPLAALLGGSRHEIERGLGVVLFALLAAGAAASDMIPGGPTLAALALLGAGCGGWTSVVGLVGAALVAHVAGASENEGVAGALRLAPAVPWILVAIAGVSLRPWALRGESAGPWVAGALVGGAFYWPLQLVWEERWGSDVVGVLPVLLGALSLVGAVGLRRALAATPDDRRLTLYIFAATAMACLAVPVQLDGPSLVVGWSVEALVLLGVMRFTGVKGLRWFAAGTAVAALVRLGMDPWVVELPDPQLHPLFNAAFAAWAAATIALWVLAREMEDPFKGILWVLGVLAAFALINVEVAFFTMVDGQPRLAGGSLSQELARSISWALYGGALLGVGLRGGRGMRLAGMAFLLLAAMKVYFYDLWSLEGLFRIASLVGAALTLLGAAIALQRWVLKSDPPRSPE